MSVAPDTWMLTDVLHPEFMRTGTESILIDSENQLATLLEQFAQRLARQLMIQSPRGEFLFVGIGGPSASVHYYPGPEGDPGLFAKPPRTFNEPVFFSAEGLATKVDPEYLMTPNTAIRVILDFYRTGELPSWIEWEEG